MTALLSTRIDEVDGDRMSRGDICLATIIEAGPVRSMMFVQRTQGVSRSHRNAFSSYRSVRTVNHSRERNSTDRTRCNMDSSKFRETMFALS